MEYKRKGADQSGQRLKSPRSDNEEVLILSSGSEASSCDEGVTTVFIGRIALAEPSRAQADRSGQPPTSTALLRAKEEDLAQPGPSGCSGSARRATASTDKILKPPRMTARMSTAPRPLSKEEKWKREKKERLKKEYNDRLLECIPRTGKIVVRAEALQEASERTIGDDYKENRPQEDRRNVS